MLEIAGGIILAVLFFVCLPLIMGIVVFSVPLILCATVVLFFPDNVPVMICAGLLTAFAYVKLVQNHT